MLEYGSINVVDLFERICLFSLMLSKYVMITHLNNYVEYLFEN